MTLPTIPIHRDPPAPKPEPVTASALSANVGMMCQVATAEVWVSSDEEE